ncbi:TPA: Ail/Lom family outer membrane beta-barrel protein [Salmonella enterica]|nr:Ail/Lom family outer membrane beta-barrel protein [Salmonella enterica]
MKIAAAILIPCVLGVSGAAIAANGQSALTVGYAQVHTGALNHVGDTLHLADMNGRGLSDPKGVNVRYRYELTDRLGMMASFSFAESKSGDRLALSDTRWHEASARMRYLSVMAGPTLRVTDWLSGYVMAGAAYTRLSGFSGDWQRVTGADGLITDELVRGDSNRVSQTRLAYSAGVQVDITDQVVADLAWEGAGSGDWRTSAFIVGIGYRF